MLLITHQTVTMPNERGISGAPLDAALSSNCRDQALRIFGSYFLFTNRLNLQTFDNAAPDSAFIVGHLDCAKNRIKFREKLEQLSRHFAVEFLTGNSSLGNGNLLLTHLMPHFDFWHYPVEMVMLHLKLLLPLLTSQTYEMLRRIPSILLSKL